MIDSHFSAKKYNELFPKEKKEKEKKPQQPKKETTPKKKKTDEPDPSEEDDIPKVPKFVDPYASLPRR